MSIGSAEATKDHPALVCFAVTIIVLQKQQFSILSDISPAIAQLNPGGDHEAVREHRGFCAPSLASGIFQNQDFIVRSLTWLDLRINRAADDPEPPARIEPHLDWFNHAVLFRRKPFHFKPVCDAEGGNLA